jgi:hypothetical protein
MHNTGGVTDRVARGIYKAMKLAPDDQKAAYARGLEALGYKIDRTGEPIVDGHGNPVKVNPASPLTHEQLEAALARVTVSSELAAENMRYALHERHIPLSDNVALGGISSRQAVAMAAHPASPGGPRVASRRDHHHRAALAGVGGPIPTPPIRARIQTADPESPLAPLTGAIGNVVTALSAPFDPKSAPPKRLPQWPSFGSFPP